jgi:hypothetical protein
MKNYCSGNHKDPIYVRIEEVDAASVILSLKNHEKTQNNNFIASSVATVDALHTLFSNFFDKKICFYLKEDVLTIRKMYNIPTLSETDAQTFHEKT